MFHYLILLEADALQGWTGPSTLSPTLTLLCPELAVGTPWEIVHDPSNPLTSPQIGPGSRSAILTNHSLLFTESSLTTGLYAVINK